MAEIINASKIFHTKAVLSGTHEFVQQQAPIAGIHEVLHALHAAPDIEKPEGIIPFPTRRIPPPDIIA